MTVIESPATALRTDVRPDLSRAFATITMLAACVLIAARLAAPFEVEKDQALQLQAALRLASGLGLTSTTATRFTPTDIAVAPQPHYLTWFPPGLSLLVAGLLASGLPLWAALRLLYAAVTLAGWAVWSRIAKTVLASSAGAAGRVVLPAVALVLPIALTPAWSGTDIFLWAGLGFFIRALVVKGPPEKRAGAVVAAGVLGGALCIMRYASAFLGLGGMLVVLWTWRFDPRRWMRALQFGCGFVVGAMPGALFNVWASSTALPAYVAQDAPRIDALVERLPTVSSLWIGAPLVQRVLLHVPGSAPLLAVFGILVLILALVLPFTVLRAVAPPTSLANRTVLALAVIPSSLVVFLLCAEAVTAYGPMGVSRYYEPVALCWLFVWLSFAFRQPTADWRLRVASSVGLALFAAQTLLFLPLEGVVERTRGRVAKRVLGFTPPRSLDGPSTSAPISYPSLATFSRKESTRAFIRDLHRAQPESIFYVLGSYQLYVYDDAATVPDPATSLRDFPSKAIWASASTSRPLHVYWVLEAPSQTSQLKEFDFVPGDNLKQVFVDVDERTEIYESRFPAGYRFVTSRD